MACKRLSADHYGVEILSPWGNVITVTTWLSPAWVKAAHHETKFPAKVMFYQNLQNHLECIELNKENWC